MARAQWKWAVLVMVWEVYPVSGFVGPWWLQKSDIRSRPKKGSHAMKMNRSGNGLGSLSRFPRKIALAQWIWAVSAYSRAWVPKDHAYIGNRVFHKVPYEMFQDCSNAQKVPPSQIRFFFENWLKLLIVALIRNESADLAFPRSMQINPDLPRSTLAIPLNIA